MSSVSAQSPSKLAIWVMASRPKTLPASITPVLVGSALAASRHAFAWGPALAALVGATLIQIGSNLANDYFDAKQGADTAERLGPTRVTQAGLASPGAVAAATAIVFALAVLVGIYLVAVGGWPIVVIGICSILAAVAYTGGPFPLGYNGLGEVFVFLFFGLVAVLGTVWVEAHHLTTLDWLVAVPIGLLSSAILVVNNLRDLATDRVAGKRTLAVRFGEKATKLEYAGLLVLSYLFPVALVASGKVGYLGLIPLLSIPLGIRLWRQVNTQTGRALNLTLAGTGQLVLVFGVLLSVGLLR